MDLLLIFLAAFAGACCFAVPLHRAGVRRALEKERVGHENRAREIVRKYKANQEQQQHLLHQIGESLTRERAALDALGDALNEQFNMFKKEREDIERIRKSVRVWRDTDEKNIQSLAKAKLAEVRRATKLLETERKALEEKVCGARAELALLQKAIDARQHAFQDLIPDEERTLVAFQRAQESVREAKEIGHQVLEQSLEVIASTSTFSVVSGGSTD